STLTSVVAVPLKPDGLRGEGLTICGPMLTPPGAVLTHMYKGRALPVTVLPPGFACDGLALPRLLLPRLSPILSRCLSELALEYRAQVLGMLEARLEGDLLQRP